MIEQNESIDNLHPNGLRRLRIGQVVDKVALPKSTIYAKIKAGTFPDQYKDGASAFWFEHELDEWL